MLTKPVILCVNRGGQSLDTAMRVAEHINWPVIGTDPRDLHMVDAGNAIVGFGFQIVSVLDISQTGSCAADPAFTAAVSTEPTLASSLEIASESIPTDARRAAAHLQMDAAAVSATATEGTDATRLHWTDVNGNLFTYAQFNESALQGSRGTHYKQILARSAKKRPVGNPLVGVTLLVSSLKASRDFYEGQLGMTVVDQSHNDVTLDAGHIVLRLRPEPAAGMIRRYTLTATLRDQISFYTPDVRAETDHLVKHGILFSSGIQWSVSGGGLAKFQDPDGYGLWLWQPQPRHLPDMPINYVPVISRILKEVGLRLPAEGYNGPFTIEAVPFPNPVPLPPGMVAA
jgi:catechol 2,3-dioxygenase-like lactoylglutathione lyase family enzyme